MTTRFTQDMPEGVTIQDQCEFLIDECDTMIKQTSWVQQRGGDVQDVITARRLRRFLEAVKEELLSIMCDPTEGPETSWVPRHRQALLWAIGVETPIDFDDEVREE